MKKDASFHQDSAPEQVSGAFSQQPPGGCAKNGLASLPGLKPDEVQSSYVAAEVRELQSEVFCSQNR